MLQSKKKNTRELILFKVMINYDLTIFLCFLSYSKPTRLNLHRFSVVMFAFQKEL